MTKKGVAELRSRSYTWNNIYVKLWTPKQRKRIMPKNLLFTIWLPEHGSIN